MREEVRWRVVQNMVQPNDVVNVLHFIVSSGLQLLRSVDSERGDMVVALS